MKPLNKSDYHKANELLNQVAINNLFARAVIEDKAPGEVFVDDRDNPKTFYVKHSYGMSLLFGDCNNPVFNQAFRNYALNLTQQRNAFEWMQAYPNNWDDVLLNLFGQQLIKSAENTSKIETEIVELNTRVNFSFDKTKYLELRSDNSKNEITIIRTDRESFRNMKGSVIPAYFWKSEDDFLENGVGFSLLHEGNLASTAYSAFIQENQLEIGIETIEGFRGKGYAELVCASLIDYCIENNLEPVWACRFENTASFKLAHKLGFVPSRNIPYYRLSK